MTEQAERFDLIVVGTGQGGPAVAAAFAEAGKRVAVIEKDEIGGSCVNYGCTPTKTMVASARAAHLARSGETYGVHTGPIRVDLQRVRRRKEEVVTSFREGSLKHLEETGGLELVRGEARFSGQRVLDVVSSGNRVRRLSGEAVFLNTGARPNVPPIEGLAEAGYLDSTTIMDLGEVPDHLIVVGGGYVGLEFGQMFRRFGSDVTILQRAPRIIPREDEDVTTELTEILRSDGLRVQTSTTPTRVAAGQSGVSVDVSTPEGRQRFEGSHLLVAAGRRPNTEALHLPAGDIETTKSGHIRVNARLETSAAGVYALGDVKGGPAFTHIAYDDYRILRANLLEDGAESTQDRLIPYTIFTDPQLGRVGLTDREARRRRGRVRVAKLPMASVARAIETGETRGFMKVIVDGTTGRILGGAMLGIEGGELMSALQIAMLGGLRYTTLRDTAFAHPTLTESFNNLFQSFENE